MIYILYLIYLLEKHSFLKNLKIFSEEHPKSRLIVVSLDVFTRHIGSIECMYVKDFFNQLWAGQII